MSSEQLRNSVNYSGGVDPMLVSKWTRLLVDDKYSRLALKVLHDVEEPIVHIGLVMKLDFDLIQVGEGILRTKRISIQPGRSSEKSA